MASEKGSYVAYDDLRVRFAAAMSQMYKAEVPLYGELMEIVRDINRKILQRRESVAQNDLDVSAERLSLERHGAIRLGTPFELKTVCRLFRLLGMTPHGYYDLSIAGLPVHATCFRPTDLSSLAFNPFRVFTTLLRPELLSSDEARRSAWMLLTERRIFTDELLEMLGTAEAQDGRLTQEQANGFISHALRTFSWQPVAASTVEQYNTLKAEHPILADVACFSTAHINHLTPRTLDISDVQEAMRERGMAVKDTIEGPPTRQCPILLRQTSFLALEEPVKFHKGMTASADDLVQSSHKARFGEIEQRGAAVTRKGRELYDRLLAQRTAASASPGLSPQDIEAKTEEIFQQYPDTWEELRRQGLIYCEYKLVHQPIVPVYNSEDGTILEQWIGQGCVKAVPITYEDFLPLSAAGIFQSNLQASKTQRAMFANPGTLADKSGLEKSMGVDIVDLDAWYSRVQEESLVSIAQATGRSAESLLLP